MNQGGAARRRARRQPADPNARLAGLAAADRRDSDAALMLPAVSRQPVHVDTLA